MGFLLASSFEVQRCGHKSSPPFILIQRWFFSQTDGERSGWITVDVGHTLEDVLNIFKDNPFLQKGGQFVGHRQGEWFASIWSPQAFKEFVQVEFLRTFFATRDEAQMTSRYNDNNVSNCLFFAVRLGQKLKGPADLFQTSVQTFRQL